ncbi:PH, RCC1 and FYVE domains-containing protein 1-like [Bidens hawaiensis]|uniref:PH, RCC1 and FYVE domains-containing protein 1-like n=1 Tax=Bidens hawaiensis TaxID=980011 RepID=UPI0040498359
MSERLLSLTPSDRALEQAIVALKKGAYILKYGRRGKPKLCPFRLSADERTLIWFSGKEERQLQLSSVTSIIRGHRTRKLQPERESHSFSLIYTKNQAQCSLDLICRDKDQADSWFLGLKALISRSQDHFCHLDHQKRATNFINSPTSFIRRKYNLGFHREITKTAQVRNICASPSSIPSLSDRCFSDGLSFSSDSLYSRSSLSSVHNLTDPCLKHEEQENPPKMTGPTLDSSHKPNITKRSDVFIWGERFNNGEDALLPTVLESVNMLDVVKISLAGTHAVLVTKLGEVFCWGEGKSGRVGHCPKEVETLDGVRVKSVSCSEYQTCALTDSGQLYTWSGQLPRRVLDGVSVSTVACGEWHTAIVSTSGQLFTFGDGTFGVLGHGNCQSLTEPKQVDSLKGMRVKWVACGPWHMAAVVGVMNSSTPAGKLFTWGDGDKGRLGHGKPDTIDKPTCVIALIDHEFVQVSCGRMLTVGLTTTGMVYTIGSSVHGQLGNPQARDHSITLVQGKLKFEFVKEISSGSYHVAVLTSKGNVYTWGKGANGQLGVGDTEDRSSPTLVESLKNGKVQSISCGSSSTGAVCLHKSVTFGNEQSGCRGCNKEFGFMKKKHSCYSCGFSFCGMCSSNRSKNTSLAPDKTKSVRVCDSCYKSLSGQMMKIEDYTPRPLLIKTLFEETGDKVAGSGLDLDFELGSLLTSRGPRWGRVSSPASFRKEEPLSRISVRVNDNPLNTSHTSLDSTVKRKGAKDVLKALTSRLHSMSPRAFIRNRSKPRVDTPTHLPSDAIIHGGNTRRLNELVVKETGSEQNEVKQKPTEWTVQYRLGVYITFVMLPTDQKGIKRVRFSRKVFREREAERWWEENQQQVYDTYNVDGYINSF